MPGIFPRALRFLLRYSVSALLRSMPLAVTTREGNMTSRWHIGAGCAALLLAATSAYAEDVYMIGMSAGRASYAVTVDRAWRDGVEVAIAALNAKGGIAGRKIELVVEGKRCEPQGGGRGAR